MTPAAPPQNRTRPKLLVLLQTMLKERPGRLNVRLLMLVVAHGVITNLGYLPQVWAGLLVNVELARSIYTSVTSAGALLAGFAGVVVVFGLTSSSTRFRRFRKLAGASLKRNWSSVSASGFWAMGLGFFALLMSSGNLDLFAVWILELALLLLAHSSARLIWILNVLVQIVSRDDESEDKKDRTLSSEDLPFPPR